MENNNLNSTGLLFFAFKWRWHLIIITVIAAIAAAIFSSPYFIQPTYKSTVILFPTTTNSISKALLSEDVASKQDILEFGQEDEAEQMLQILNSDEIRDIVIKKYNLMQHYKIDSAGDYPLTKLYKKFEGNVSFERTEFMSVKIEVLDTDPKKAAAMANDIAVLVDSMKSNIQRERALEAYKIVGEEFMKSKQIADSMENELSKLRKQGIFDYGAQTKIYNESYTEGYSGYLMEKGKLEIYEKALAPNDTLLLKTKARVNGLAAQTKQMKLKLDELAAKGGQNVILNEYLYQQRKTVVELKRKFDKTAVDVNRKLTNKFIVNKAFPAEKKSYPLRLIIVLVSMVGALFIGILTIMIIENLQVYKNQNS
jgi:capsular polysaccharide biosynthesis protein